MTLQTFSLTDLPKAYPLTPTILDWIEKDPVLPYDLEKKEEQRDAFVLAADRCYALVKTMIDSSDYHDIKGDAENCEQLVFNEKRFLDDLESALRALSFPSLFLPDNDKALNGSLPITEENDQ